MLVAVKGIYLKAKGVNSHFLEMHGKLGLLRLGCITCGRRERTLVSNENSLEINETAGKGGGGSTVGLRYPSAFLFGAWTKFFHLSFVAWGGRGTKVNSPSTAPVHAASANTVAERRRSLRRNVPFDSESEGISLKDLSFREKGKGRCPMRSFPEGLFPPSTYRLPACLPVKS